MAQPNSEEKVSENPEMEVNKEAINGDGDDGSSNSSIANLAFRFNAQAPEFFPRSQTQMPVTGYFHPYFHFLGGGPATSDWFFIGDQEPAYLIPNPNIPLPNFSKTARSEEIQQKIIKQVPSFPFLFITFFLHCRMLILCCALGGILNCLIHLFSFISMLLAV